MAMEIPSNLTLEQEFKLQILREQVKSLELEQAQDYIVELLRQMMVKDNMVKNMFKNA